jgi:preprotein translocase subunit SecE
MNNAGIASVGTFFKKNKDVAKMAVTKKQDGNKKEQVKRDIVLNKDKKEAAKKELPAKKDLPAKKEQVNRIEQVQKFFKGTLNELKKVHWPNRREIIIYTSVVLVAVVAVGVLIWLFDSALSFVLTFIL